MWRLVLIAVWSTAVWSTACVVASAPPPVPAHLGAGGTVETHTFHSAALGVDKRYLVYLPRGYADGPRRFPVLYLLHGAGGDEDSWTRDGGLVAAADRLQLAAIVVMPDGDDGFYTNWATPVDYDGCLAGRRTLGGAEPGPSYCVRTPRYEDYVVRDLVTHIDAMFRTIPSRAARALGGYSAGGFGALALAMRHKDLFAAASSHSGLTALLYRGPYPFDEEQPTVLVRDVSRWGHELGAFGGFVRGIFGPTLANWQEHDPSWLGPRLRDGQLALYVDCGTEDAQQLDDQARYFHHELTYAGIKHRFTLLPGGHDFTFWRDRIDDSLAFHMEQFAAAR